MTETPNIYGALAAVMKQVGAVKKGDRNDTQHYSFRGVDAVVNAVYPALLENGVTVQPNVRQYDYGTVHVGSGNNPRPMGHARVVVEYTFTAVEDGSAVTTSAAGEAFDSGDKATPKAMSVALRTALLQSLMLPTDEPEPDSYSYERAERPASDPLLAEKQTVAAAWRKSNRGNFDKDAAEQLYGEWTEGELLSSATAARLEEFARYLMNTPAPIEADDEALASAEQAVKEALQ